MTNLYVTKRSGELQHLDITKIRKVVNWACEPFPELNPIDLEAHVGIQMYDGISTRDIQEHVINCAKNLASPEAPRWKDVAGRLLMWNYNQEVKLSTGRVNYSTFTFNIQQRVTHGEYTPDILKYSQEELKQASNWIIPERDYIYDYGGANLIIERVLSKNELLQEVLLTQALLLALPERPEERLQYALTYYGLISTKKISLATPIIQNLRKQDASLTSCFITTIEDNLESIFKGVTDTAKISKAGGGVGVTLSWVRARGSDLMGVEKKANGVLPMAKLFNDTAVAINQGKQICPLVA